MKDIMNIRTEMVEVPKCLPYKFDGNKFCRYKCEVEEDIKHAVSCERDLIDHKIIKEEDINDIINDKFNKTLKIKLKDLKNIAKTKNIEYKSRGLYQDSVGLPTKIFCNKTNKLHYKATL